MKYRTFGRLDWRVSEIGFGAWVDTAHGYGDGHSEQIIGRVLKERKGDRVYVATKIPSSRANIFLQTCSERGVQPAQRAALDN